MMALRAMFAGLSGPVLLPVTSSIKSFLSVLFLCFSPVTEVLP